MIESWTFVAQYRFDASAVDLFGSDIISLSINATSKLGIRVNWSLAIFEN